MIKEKCPDCGGKLKSKWYGTDEKKQLFKSKCEKCGRVIYQENPDYPNVDYNKVTKFLK